MITITNENFEEEASIISTNISRFTFKELEALAPEQDIDYMIAFVTAIGVANLYNTLTNVFKNHNDALNEVADFPTYLRKVADRMAKFGWNATTH